MTSPCLSEHWMGHCNPPTAGPHALLRLNCSGKRLLLYYRCTMHVQTCAGMFCASAGVTKP